MENNKLEHLISNALSHISTQPAEIANRELVREIKAYISDLEHFKNIHVGLWATDIEPDDKSHFFQISA